MSTESVQISQVSKQQSPSSYPHSALLLLSSHTPSPTNKKSHTPYILSVVLVPVPEVVTDVVEGTLFPFPLENAIERSPKNRYKCFI